MRRVMRFLILTPNPLAEPWQQPWWQRLLVRLRLRKPLVPVRGEIGTIEGVTIIRD